MPLDSCATIRLPIRATSPSYCNRLYEVTTHVHALTLSGGPNILTASTSAWNRPLSPGLAAILE